MKTAQSTRRREPSAGSRIIASLREAVDWAEVVFNCGYYDQPHFVHDFQSFSSNPGYKKATTVRRLTRCDVKKSGAQFAFIIEGDGFLYKMCRGIVGTIVQAGLGKFPPGEVKTMLAKADRRVAGMTAPAHGLVLWKVYYAKRKSRQN